MFKKLSTQSYHKLNRLVTFAEDLSSKLLRRVSSKTLERHLVEVPHIRHSHYID